jgi:23S rRNA (guanosine2251-2'-O)-methyltransferase
LPVSHVSKEMLEEISSTKKNQGIVAEIYQRNLFDSKTAIAYLSDINDPVVLILDDLDDPRNIGACFRTANAVKVDMVVLSKNRVSLESPIISKVSSGASELTNTAIVSNLSQFIDRLKDIGFWICGTTGDSTTDFKTIDYTQSTAIIMGSEAKGMRRLTEKKCDHVVSIPINGEVDSLNVSVSCGVILYEVVRQRQSI